MWASAAKASSTRARKSERLLQQPVAIGKIPVADHVHQQQDRFGAVRRVPFSSGSLGSGTGRYICLYAGPLPPSRGVQRGPITSVALQSMQLGAFTTSRSPRRS